jgi:hypothetical protein
LPRITSGFFADFSRSTGALDGVGGGDLLGRRVDDLDQRLLAGFLVHALREQLGRQVQVDAARAAGDGGADGARDAHADVLGVQHAEGGLAQGLGDGQLVHLLVVALLQVDDLALAGARDQDHGEAVGGGVRQRGEAVQEAGRGHREADAGLAVMKAGGCGGIAGVLLVAEGDHLHAVGLRDAQEVGDRDAGQGEDRVDVVQLQRVDDEVEAIGRFAILRFGAHGRGSSDGVREW